jgi:glycosyltransferase involved in cell wall biosynthesis
MIVSGKSNKPVRVLFTSHACTYSGAPISFLTLIRYLIRTERLDARIVVRKGGPLREQYETLAPTSVFMSHYVPGDDLLPPDRRAGFRKDYTGRIGEFVRTVRSRRKQRRHVAGLRRELSAWKPDVVYSNTALNGDVINAIGVTAPVMVHVRELAVSLSLLSPLQVDRFVRQPRRYLAVSPPVMEYITHHYDIPRERVTVVPVALDLDTIKEQGHTRPPSAIRAELKIPEGALVAGVVGSVDWRKGADIFFEASRTILQRWEGESPVHFIWVGEGGMRSELERRAREQGLDDRIHFTGIKRNPYPFMNAFDLVLTPSRDDPFPRVNLESAVFGVPVVCFEESGGSVNFVENDAGVVVPGFEAGRLAAAALDLLADNSRRRALWNRAQRKVHERYDVKVVGPRVAELMFDIMAPAS